MRKKYKKRVSSSFFRFWVEETGRNPFLVDGKNRSLNRGKNRFGRNLPTLLESIQKRALEIIFPNLSYDEALEIANINSLWR